MLCCFLVLPERQCVAENHAGFVDITAEVAAHRGVAHLHAEVLQRPALDYIGDVGVALPLFTFCAACQVDVVTGHVTSHQAQPGDTRRSEVIVVADLPGFL